MLLISNSLIKKLEYVLCIIFLIYCKVEKALDETGPMTAAGYYTVNKGTFLNITSSAIGYLIILVQFNSM